MKRITKIFVALAMVLSMSNMSMVDVSAAETTVTIGSLSLVEGVEATGDGWTWDEDDCILTITEDLTVSGEVGDDYVIEFYLTTDGGTAKI